MMMMMIKLTHVGFWAHIKLAPCTEWRKCGSAYGRRTVCCCDCTPNKGPITPNVAFEEVLPVKRCVKMRKQDSLHRFLPVSRNMPTDCCLIQQQIWNTAINQELQATYSGQISSTVISVCPSANNLICLIINAIMMFYRCLLLLAQFVGYLLFYDDRSSRRNCSATSRKCTRLRVSSGRSTWASLFASRERPENSLTAACLNQASSR